MRSTTFTDLVNLNSVQARHHESILSSLMQRIKIAQAVSNPKLLQLLEQERQQLEKIYQKSSDKQTKGNLWSWLLQDRQITIEELHSPSGSYFRGYNPTTNEIRYGETEADMIDWLEEKSKSKSKLKYLN